MLHIIYYLSRNSIYIYIYITYSLLPQLTSLLFLSSQFELLGGLIYALRINYQVV